MVSRENKVIVAFVAAAMMIFFAGTAFTQLDYLVLLVILILVGILAPMAVNNYLDREQAT